MKYRIWWIPGVPGTAFKRKVDSVEEAKRLLNTLVDYTRYLEDRQLMPDYAADAGGIEENTPWGWEEWYDEDDNAWEYERTSK